MDRPLRHILFWLWATVLVAGGAACPQVVRQYTAPLPMLPADPTLADLTAAINANTAKIESLTSVDLTLQTSLAPQLRGNLAYERPRRLRLIAETALTGPELDLGSNDDLFWLWVRRNDPPSLLYCRHDEFARAPARRMIPVEPLQVVELLGLVTFDETGAHTGPHPQRGGRLEIHSRLPSPQGELTRVVVVDPRQGWVLEQHLFDGKQRMASAILSKHCIDPLTQAVMPERVELHYVPQNLELKLAVKEWYINVPEAIGGSERWQPPHDASWQRINLAHPPAAPPGSPASPLLRPR